MKKAFRRILKRVFIFIVVAFAIYMVFTNIGVFQDLARKDTLSLIVDTDAGYGIDDSFAVSMLLMEENVQIMGLLSSQWHYADLKNDSTMYLSHDANYRLVRLFDRTQIPRYPGAELPLCFDEKPWSRKNQGAKFIADRAMEVLSGEKLTVLCLGPSTNLATAVMMKPEAASRIRCYMLGPGYDPVRRVWNKNEFNARNDLDALDVLLNTKDLELHIMTANLAEGMVITRSNDITSLEQNHKVLNQLRKSLSDAGSDSVSMASLALVQAVLNPELASEKQVFTPPENNQRKIYVYTRIDIERMKKDLWRSMERFTKTY